MFYPRFVLLVSILILIGIASCSRNRSSYVTIKGQTMGTTYHITYKNHKSVKIKQQKIDSILNMVNHVFSTYIDSSIISSFNSSSSVYVIPKKYIPIISDVWNISKQVYLNSQGAFNPCIQPLVNYWGFGPMKNNTHTIDSAYVKKTIDLMDFECLSIRQCLSINQDENLIFSTCLFKPYPHIKLDFNAIAKGYGVDQIYYYLLSENIKDFMVEIGGEVRVSGLNSSHKKWKIGIDHPATEDHTKHVPYYIISLDKSALATSGNYRNYRWFKNHKIGHTINPYTGYSEINDILSASIKAPSCAIADAYATACMVMGSEKAIKTIEKVPQVSAFLIIQDSLKNIQSIQTSDW